MVQSNDNPFDQLANASNVFDFSRFSYSLPRASGGRDDLPLLSAESGRLLRPNPSPGDPAKASLRAIEPSALLAPDSEPALSSALTEYYKPARYGRALAVISPKRPRIDPKRNPYGKNPWGRKGTLRCERCRQMRKKVISFGFVAYQSVNTTQMTRSYPVWPAKSRDLLAQA